MTTNPAEQTGACPSDYELDAFWMDGAPANHGVRRHLEACPSCRMRMAEYGQVQERFWREVFPVTEPRVVEAVCERSPGSRLRAMFSLRLAAAASAVVLLLVVGVILWGSREVQHHEETSSYVGVKGSVGLQIFCKRGQQSFRVFEGDTLLEDDMLRFMLSPPGTGYVMVVAVDAQGRTHLYHPGQGALAQRVTGLKSSLTPSVVLDASRGPERIFAVFSTRSFGFQEVQAAASQAWSRGPDVKSLSRLPLDAVQTSMLFLKESK